ncbi:MAG: sugar-binding domain-containing protein [Eubacteriales bacterium]|jgi:hypothetical protein
MEKLCTAWTIGDVPLPEYPRPQLMRDNYVILNGLWDYAITGTKERPIAYDGRILVPYSPETRASLVGRVLEPEQFLHYRRLFRRPSMPQGSRLILHFEAVDYSCSVTVNGHPAGSHRGGYLPFSFDVTDLADREENELLVTVSDPSDTFTQARGKQSLHPGGMFYQATSGIWQTVWLEVVPELFVTGLKLTPLPDRGAVRVRIFTSDNEGSAEDHPGERRPARHRARAEIFAPRTDVTDSTFTELSEEPLAVYDLESSVSRVLPVRAVREWTPEEPYLYPVRITVGKDCVMSYFGLRTFSGIRDWSGHPRFALNGSPYFMNGVLDQGYWPESYLTQPCDAALIFDIQEMKNLGFNMLRKHVKLESRRWYYHCDRLGMLVWQDMVSGGAYSYGFMTVLPTVLPAARRLVTDRHHELFGRDLPMSRLEYRRDVRGMLKTLYNCVSICTWVPFNEGWGQFDADLIVRMIEERDGTRLVDQASGWFDCGGGDYISSHEYFKRLLPPLRLLSLPGRDDRIWALTEYGGVRRSVSGHEAFPEKNSYGYGKAAGSEEELTDAIVRLVKRQVLPNLRHGLSAAVYTQLSDVEEEVNGLLTWDRKVRKVDASRIRELNREVQHMFLELVSQTL